MTSASHAAGDSPAEPVSEVVASGLDNPRQLTFGPRGALYVAEAGTGGAGPCLEGPAGVTCFGETGAVTRISKRGVQTRVLEGLPSLAEADGTAALGASDLVVGNKGRRFVLAVGLGNDPAVRDELPAAGGDLASLLTGRFRAGTWRQLSDLGAFEAAENPDGQLPDTNPVAVIRDGGDYVVVDAGANALLSVDDDGDVEEVLAVFPRQRAGGTRVDAVPTSVAEGPDDALYVSQLTGFPFVPGAAKIWRVEDDDDDPEVYAKGLTNVTDLAFDDDELYAVQISDTGILSGLVGSLVRVDPEDGDHETVVSGLFAPYGLAIREEQAYITTCAVCPGGGEVIKVDLDADD